MTPDGKMAGRAYGPDLKPYDACMIRVIGRHRTPTGFTWSTAPFYHAVKRSEEQNLAVAVVHSPPAGHLRFSDADNIAEKETFEIAFNRCTGVAHNLWPDSFFVPAG